MQGSSPKPCKIFDDGEWYSYQCEFEYMPDTREETARKMVQYLEDCGKSTKEVIKELKTKYGITL
jgi:predicted transcriptional regulator